MSIGDALEELHREFPAVTITKLRYLEDMGLILPARSPAGYRKFSPADIERLRFVLTAQRDHYWPLTVIRSKLAALDAGHGDAPNGLLGPRSTFSSASVGVDEVATISGAPVALVEEVAHAAGVDIGREGIDAALVQAVEACVELGESGVDLRHAKPVFQTARRVADLIEAAASAQRGRGSVGRERAAAHAAEMAESVARLNQALLRLALAERDL